jgi:hypothetical protein
MLFTKKENAVLSFAATNGKWKQARLKKKVKIVCSQLSVEAIEVLLKLGR